ncbi:uncharacterized protein LOC114360158 [Ostrinia furnacalis]|uniref:uncharacterized protein LOC114360158 n=1 Tax=Ostrinia furnacalis TaxID=93504 RepID=UPI00103DAC33|nr:uncharacterized protein LOC114360158 [Ostrinia furnacalis]
MDSSDSEDDCYGNIAQKLQRMKNNYKEDTIETTNLLNESTTELDEIVKSAELLAKKRAEASLQEKKNEEASKKEEQDADLLDTLLATSSKRMTRSAAKRASSDTNSSEGTAPKRANRRKRGGKASQSATNTDTTPDTVQNVVETPNVQNTTQPVQNVPQTQQNTPRTRGRGRGRGRGGRSRGRNSRGIHIPNFWGIPTYSVGNTDEYPDQSDSQQLFSSKPKSDDVVLVEDSEVLDENEELSVKVYWQSSEFFKFMIRRFQKLTQIFDYFSQKENVSHDKLLFTFNDRILKPDDTPDTINYSIVKFIDGGIVNQSVSKLVKDDNNKKDQNGIKLKFQCQNVKKPFETWIGIDDKVGIAMMKCAEHFEISIDKLRFYFDGDLISGRLTAQELELEGGECIDVQIITLGQEREGGECIDVQIIS